MKLSEARKILAAFEKSHSKRCLSLEDMSRLTGYYPDVLGEYFAYFDPMASLDSSFNLKVLEEPVREYISGLEERAAKRPKRIIVTKRTLKEFPTIGDFVYKKMTGAGGLVDPSSSLSDEDLMILHKLVENEVANRKKERRKARSKKK